MRAHGIGRIRGSQRSGCEDRKAEPHGFARDRAFAQLHAAARGLRRARIDRNDVVTAPDELKQRGYGKVRRTHKDEAKRQLRLHCLLRRLLRLGCLGEFLDDAVALELGDVIDEEHAVGVIDLVLQAGRE